MKENQDCRHYKGGMYWFLGVTLPKTTMLMRNVTSTQQVFHTEDEKWITLYNTSSGVCFTDYDEYFVLYQSHEDEDAKHLYARPVKMFFEHVEVDGKFVPRFEAIDKDRDK